MLEMNVAHDNEALVKALPAMRSPTVSSYTAITALLSNSCKNQKSQTYAKTQKSYATDILEYELRKVAE